MPLSYERSATLVRSRRPLLAPAPLLEQPQAVQPVSVSRIDWIGLLLSEVEDDETEFEIELTW